MVLTKVGLPRTARQPAIDIDGLWVRRTRFHEPAMQDPSKGADELPQKGFAKKKGRSRRKRERDGATMAAERGQASSLVNAGFRAPFVGERKDESEGESGGRG
jgi:hypothetical protein